AASARGENAVRVAGIDTADGYSRQAARANEMREPIETDGRSGVHLGWRGEDRANAHVVGASRAGDLGVHTNRRADDESGRRDAAYRCDRQIIGANVDTGGASGERDI